MSQPVADEFSWRRIAIPAYGPSLVASIGQGAVNPILAIAARELGASVPLAALIVALPLAVEMLVAVPVGTLIDRIGERTALTLAGLLELVVGVIGWLADSLVALAVAAILIAPAVAVFVVGRQSFLAQVAPAGQRARAMSTLGGVARIGWFLGPLLSVPLIDAAGARGAFVVLAVAGLASAVLTWFTMDLPVPGLGRGAAPELPRPPLKELVRRHAAVLLTVGVGVVMIGVSRSGRLTVLPLWADSVGLGASDIAKLFSASFFLEVLLFYPAGWVMDRFGRAWIAVPLTMTLGACLVALPLARTLGPVAALALVMGAANGLGSGIVMTLGADAAPVEGRAAFLGIWRWLGLIGQNGVAVAVAIIAAAASLSLASVVVGIASVVGAGWLLVWLPRHDPTRRERQRPPAAYPPDAGEP